MLYQHSNVNKVLVSNKLIKHFAKLELLSNHLKMFGIVRAKCLLKIYKINTFLNTQTQSYNINHQLTALFVLDSDAIFVLH